MKNIKKMILIFILGMSVFLVACGNNDEKFYTWVDFKLEAKKEAIQNIVHNKNGLKSWKNDDDFNKVSVVIEDDKQIVIIKISDDTLHEVADFELQYFNNSTYNVNGWHPLNWRNNYYSWNLFKIAVDAQFDNSASINQVIKKVDPTINWPDVVVKNKIIQTPDSLDNGSQKFRIIFVLQQSSLIEKIQTYDIIWDLNDLNHNNGQYNIKNWTNYLWTDYQQDAEFISAQSLINFCSPINWYIDPSKLTIKSQSSSDKNHTVSITISNEETANKKVLSFISLPFDTENPLPYTTKNPQQWICDKWLDFLKHSRDLALANDIKFKQGIVSYLIGAFSDKMTGWDGNVVANVKISNIKSIAGENPNLKLTLTNNESNVTNKVINVIYLWDAQPYYSANWSLKSIY